MNNKNEKTFADLFLNVQNNDDKEDKAVNFDVFSNSVDTDNAVDNNKVDNTSFSFNNLNTISSNEFYDEKKENETISKDEPVVHDELTFEKNIFNIAVNDVDNVINDDKEVADGKIKTINTNIENTIFDIDENDSASKISFNDVKLENNDDVNFINNSYIDESNLNNNKNILDSVGELKNKNKEVIKSDDILENSNLFEVNPVISSDIDNIPEVNNTLENSINNIVKNDKGIEVNNIDTTENNNESVKIEENIFGFDTSNNNIEKVNNNVQTMLVDSTGKLENNRKEEVAVDSNTSELGIDNVDSESKIEKSDSPFFSDVEDNEISNPLFNNNVSLDESNNVKKDINKLNLSNTKHFNVQVVTKKEPLTKFIIGVISYAFFIWLLLIGITLLVYVLDIKIRAAKGDYSSPTFNAYVVLTGSMLPEIQVNDVVVTKKVEANSLDVGDIITFASTDSRFAGTIITHRIIKKNPAAGDQGITFQTKGDNNNVADSALVSANNIYGKVILKIPKLGYLQEFLATDGGWIIVILIPCLTVISYDIVKLAKGLKRKKYNNVKVKK